MIKKIDKNANRQKRHRRVRKKISGTPERPRLNVFKSNKYIYAQVIDDVNGNTLAAASSLQKPIQELIEASEDKSPARIVGESIGKNALEAGITTVVFDRGGYLYMGQVKDLAEGAREAGLKF